MFDSDENKTLIETARSRHILMNLNRAISTNSLEVHFQPLSDLETGKTVSFEALCRLKDETGAIIPPTDFIKVAEENNLIYYVDLYVFEYVCKLLKRYNLEKNSKKISVNISPKTFTGSEFVDVITVLMKKYEIGRDIISIELTETSFIESFPRAREVISKVNDLGIKILLDDFGSGYANLTTLLELDVDTIKIDKALIDNIEETKSNFIVSKAVEMAEMFDMDIVVEGIENKSQVDILKNLNCKTGQGYFFGKPLPAESIIEELRN